MGIGDGEWEGSWAVGKSLAASASSVSSMLLPLLLLASLIQHSVAIRHPITQDPSTDPQLFQKRFLKFHQSVQFLAPSPEAQLAFSSIFEILESNLISAKLKESIQIIIDWINQFLIPWIIQYPECKRRAQQYLSASSFRYHVQKRQMYSPPMMHLIEKPHIVLDIPALEEEFEHQIVPHTKEIFIYPYMNRELSKYVKVVKNPDGTKAIAMTENDMEAIVDRITINARRLWRIKKFLQKHQHEFIIGFVVVFFMYSISWWVKGFNLLLIWLSESSLFEHSDP